VEGEGLGLTIRAEHRCECGDALPAPFTPHPTPYVSRDESRGRTAVRGLRVDGAGGRGAWGVRV